MGQQSVIVEQRQTAAAANRKWKQHISALCREYTKDAVETLNAIMTDEGMPPNARIRAASEILDRGWGKAPVNIKLDAGGALDLSALSDEALKDIIAENTNLLDGIGGEQVDLSANDYAEYFEDPQDEG